ncbi:MAG TPA: methylated-DNA--[protein]-cysteine S-methyltransferase [Acidimicrobiales bacterium]|nr:methylated-DNA--[protein]-cysteine S-methyltransferase [Acidimicrobiales bacterium]
MLDGLVHTAVTTHTTIASPVGDLTVVATSGAVVGVYFPDHWYRPERSAFGAPAESGFEAVRNQLSEYFSGERRTFDVRSHGEGDEMQQRVWHLIDQVPYGETSTYGELAQMLGDGTTPQEVGATVGRNPLSILVPCHRIVGRGGKLTGYAGGLPRKQFLLDLEAATVGHPGRLF